MITDKNCCNTTTVNKQFDIDCCTEEIGETVQRLVRVFQLFERDQIKIHGFTTSQCYCMLELLKSKKLTMNQLSEKMNLNTSTMTRIVDKLVRDKHILRERDDEDRRVVFIILSDSGKEVALKMNDSIMNYYRDIINNIPEGKLLEVLETVSLLLDAFEKANPNCC